MDPDVKLYRIPTQEILILGELNANVEVIRRELKRLPDSPGEYVSNLHVMLSAAKRIETKLNHLLGEKPESPNIVDAAEFIARSHGLDIDHESFATARDYLSEDVTISESASAERMPTAELTTPSIEKETVSANSLSNATQNIPENIPSRRIRRKQQSGLRFMSPAEIASIDQEPAAAPSNEVEKKDVNVSADLPKYSQELLEKVTRELNRFKAKPQRGMTTGELCLTLGAAHEEISNILEVLQANERIALSETGTPRKVWVIKK